MSDETKGFIVFIGLLVVFFIALILENNAEDRLVHKLIKDGKDPIEVGCAYKRVSSLTCDRLTED